MERQSVQVIAVWNVKDNFIFSHDGWGNLPLWFREMRPTIQDLRLDSTAKAIRCLLSDGSMVHAEDHYVNRSLPPFTLDLY